MVEPEPGCLGEVLRRRRRGVGLEDDDTERGPYWYFGLPIDEADGSV